MQSNTWEITPDRIVVACNKGRLVELGSGAYGTVSLPELCSTCSRC